MKRTLLALAAAASFATGAAAADPGPSADREARIPFFQISRFHTFRAVDRNTLYIENRRNE